MRNVIQIRGPYPPPAGIVGPHARRTESHTFGIFDREGRRIVCGTFGPDRDAGIAHARRIAAEKGLTNPEVVFAKPAGARARGP